jgi:hypothetical protein
VEWRAALVGVLLQAEERMRADGTWTRPLRVCGMVTNDGQPGGGPFFVDSSTSPGPQIVEQAEVDATDARQAEILARATHFNPVDLVVSLRGPDGTPWDLGAFVDRTRRIVSQKSWHGTTIRTLEHPGLWNGGMGLWETIFVEIPREVFCPVKRLEDLLTAGHRA